MNRNNDIQHKIFKFIILVIVLVFICLIVGFIYVEFIANETKTDTSILYEEMYSLSYNNNKRYTYLETVDRKFYNELANSNNISLCDVEHFYKKHVINSLPCVIRNYNKEEIEFVNRYVKDITKKENKTIGNYTVAKVDNKGKMFVMKNNKENIEQNEINVLLSPISEINNLGVKKDNAMTDNFHTIQAKQNINDNKLNSISKVNVKLYKGDLLYIPAYFYIQIINNENKKVSYNNEIIEFEFKETSILHDMLFKVLFDDHKIFEDDDN